MWLIIEPKFLCGCVTALLSQSFQQVLSSRHDPECASTEIVVDNIPAWEVAAEQDKQRTELQQYCEILRQQVPAVERPQLPFW